MLHSDTVFLDAVSLLTNPEHSPSAGSRPARPLRDAGAEPRFDWSLHPQNVVSSLMVFLDTVTKKCSAALLCYLPAILF